MKKHWPDLSDSITEERINISKLLLKALVVIAPFAAVNDYLHGYPITAICGVITFVASLILLYASRYPRFHQIPLAGLLFLLMILFVVPRIFEPLSAVKPVWIPLYVVAFYFIGGKRIGTLLTVTALLLLIANFMMYPWLFNLPVPVYLMSETLGAFLLAAGISYANEHIRFQHEQELKKLAMQAKAAAQAKSEFLSNMSHEIRTPMNGVIGMIDVLQQSSLSDSQLETTNIIHDSAFALLKIIDDILDFSKIEAGKLQIDFAPMGVAEAVEGVCETLAPLAVKKGVELTLFTDPAIPSQLMGDAGRLRQILVNLTNNAIKFSSGQQRQGKVSVRAVSVENTPEQITLEFRVTDNGIGIDKATQARLFTPFSQADTTTTRTFGGTGLGLAISRQLANIMGGEVAVQSESGKGSLFRVRLPFKLLPEQADVRVALSQLADIHCLVVGDKESMADDLAAYLTHDRAVVERSADISAAVQWIASRPPGLCVVIIETAGTNTPLDALRAIADTRANVDVRFVVIGRGRHRNCRVVAEGHVELAAETMHRRAFLEAVEIAVGRAIQQPSVHDDVKAIAKPLSREEARQQGRLILVAEDNETNQNVIQRQLMLLGRTSEIASNGREALERWLSGDYGLLFTDLHMPEMDGYELTQAIRTAEQAGGVGANKPRIPIIAFTANALKGEADHCRDIGMDGYLSKPVQLVNLKTMLEKWLPMVSSDPISGEPPPSIDGYVGLKPDLRSSASMAVDVNVLKALIGADGVMIREFLHDFRISAAKIAVELRTACAAGQATAAGALAHKLKSSSRSVGALALGELCAAMEQAGKADDAETLVLLLPWLEQELTNVEGFLKKY